MNDLCDVTGREILAPILVVSMTERTGSGLELKPGLSRERLSTNSQDYCRINVNYP